MLQKRYLGGLGGESMAYTFEVPEELLRDLAHIREVTGTPIRRQIVKSLSIWVEKHKRQGVIA